MFSQFIAFTRRLFFFSKEGANDWNTSRRSSRTSKKKLPICIEDTNGKLKLGDSSRPSQPNGAGENSATSQAFIRYHYLLSTASSPIPTTYSLLPTPYSPLPTPHSLLPTPYSLLPGVRRGTVAESALATGYRRS